MLHHTNSSGIPHYNRSIFATLVFILLLLGCTGCTNTKRATDRSNLSQTSTINAQYLNRDMPAGFQALGTKSWIKISWSQDKLPKGIQDFIVSWTGTDHQLLSQQVQAGSGSFYIHPLDPEKYYKVRVTTRPNNGVAAETLFAKTVFTDTTWHLTTQESSQLDIPSSSAVPKGMELFFHDEFNDSLLNLNKWFDTYYSTIDFDNKVQWAAFQKNELPKAPYLLNGSYIDLMVNDTLPKIPFFKDGKKISSIQTYDWVTNTNKLPNARGGYYEVRVRRNYTGHPEGLNTAFWFDSPGPDLKYYYQKGTTINGVSGIRPKGQLFEIDMFENMNAQFVMHGHVDSNGHFIHNLATDIAKGYKHQDNWVVHGLLWTPNSIKHYINGQLIHSYNDPHHIYSPDHFMNVLLGAYGKGGSVSLQVDYIRAYHWAISRDNELPNGGFELNGAMLPWQGSATLSKQPCIAGNVSAKLNPGDSLYQYVYVSPATDYTLQFACQGLKTGPGSEKGGISGELFTQVSQVKEVTGILTTAVQDRCKIEDSKIHNTHLKFLTPPAPQGHTRTIRVLFKNTGTAPIYVDKVVLKRS